MSVTLPGSGVSIGVSTTGCGEHLIRTMFARLCARAAITPEMGANISNAVTTHFLGKNPLGFYLQN